MTTYIAILRGINVSGQKIIKMELLRKSFESLGFRNLTTYIQSGNVIFEGNLKNTDELSEIIRQQIQKDFGFDVPIIVLTSDDLKKIIDSNPFSNDKDVNYLHVTFLSSKPQTINFKAIEDKKTEGEEIYITDNAIFLYCPNSYGKTKLTNIFLEAKLNLTATTRNWKTTIKLFEITQI